MDKVLARKIGFPYGKTSIIVICCILTIILAGLFLSQKKTSPPEVVKDPNKIIMTVGRENIYQKDFEYEKSLMPKGEQDSLLTKQALQEKLINDSITLQQGEIDGLIVIDKFIFNTFNKDYSARIKAVENVKKIINDRTERIQGTLVSI